MSETDRALTGSIERVMTKQVVTVEPSLPLDRLPSAALRISSTKVRPAVVAKALRTLPAPVIARIHEDAVWLDLRCLEDEDGFAAQLSGRSL